MEAQPLHQRTFQDAQGEDLPFDRVTSGVVDKGRIAVEELGFHAVARHVDEAAPLLDFIHPGETLVVTRIDRLARSMHDLQVIVATLTLPLHSP